MEMAFFLLLELGVLGIVYCLLTYFEYKLVTLRDLKPFFKLKFVSIIFFVLGLLVHTLGDVVGYEMQFETVGHVIIMIGAIILIKQSLDLFTLAKRYGYD